MHPRSIWLRHLLLLLVTIGFTAILAAATNPGPEFELGVPDYSSAPGQQAAPALATDGTNYFAVWEDGRLGAGVQSIYGSRVSPEGVPLDPAGIRISQQYSGNPRVIFVGGNYLVAWQTSNGASVARVRADGMLLDAEPKTPIAAYFSGGIATNGTVAVILYRRGPNAIATILDASAEVIRTIEFPAAAPDEWDRDVLVAWNGSAFVIARIVTGATTQNALAYVSFMRPDGEITASFKTAAVMLDGQFSLAALPDRMFLTSATNNSGYNAWMFTDAGIQVGGTIPIVWDTPIAGDPMSLVTDGDTFVGAWCDRQLQARVNALRFDRDGTPLGTPVRVSDMPSQSNRAAISNGGNGTFLIAWSYSASNGDGFDVVAQSLKSMLTPVGTSSVLSLAAAAEKSPVVAWNGSVWLAVWQEDRGAAGRRLVARRFAQNGSPLEMPFEVADLSPLVYYEVAQASAASDGHDFLIAWRLNNELVLRRLSGSGAWLDSAPVSLASDASDLAPRALAWNGQSYLVVFGRYPETGPIGEGVTGILLSSGASVMSTTQISPERTNTSGAVVSTLGDKWLVAWTYIPPFPCQITCPGGDSDILGARVTAQGAVIDTAPLQFSALHSDSGPWDYASAPLIASAGGSALVTWQTFGELRGLRITADGQIDGSPDGDGTRLVPRTTWYSSVESFATAWDGQNFLVLQSDARTDSKDVLTSLYRLPTSAPLAQVEQRLEISRGIVMLEDSAFAAAICARPNGGALLAYPRAAFGAPYGGVNRLFARTIESRPRTRPTVR